MEILLMFRFTLTELLFLLSPLSSLPLVLKDIYKNKRQAYILITLLFSIISYFYLPSDSSDKAYYFELHEIFRNLNFSDFIIYVKTYNTDFIFYFIIFLFGKLGFSFSLISAIITFITLYLFLSVFQKVLRSLTLSNYMALLFFSMFIGTLTLSSLFSGLRFYLAVSFILIGLYEGVVEKKIVRSVTYLFIGVFTHFSMLIYLIIFILYLILKKKTILLKIIFLISFFFLLIPKDLLVAKIILYGGLDKIYMAKVNAYLVDDIHNQIINMGHYIYILVNHIWYYIVGIYLFYNIHKNNEYYNLMLIVFIIGNMSFFSNVMFERYSYISVSIFVLLLMYDFPFNKSKLNKIIRNIFFILMISTTVLELIVQRDRFHESLFKIEILTLPTIIFVDPTDGKHIERK